MAFAKHILTARTQGPEAGLEAYLNAPSSKIHPAYKEITRKRTPASRLATYCKLFADQIGDAQTPVQADENIGHLQAVMEQLQARINAIVGDDEDEQEPEPEFSERVLTLAGALGVDPAVLAAVLGEADTQEPEVEQEPIVTNETFITMDVAWAVLKATTGDETVQRPSPDRRGVGASNNQLWRMNQEGLFEASAFNALASA